MVMTAFSLSYRPGAGITGSKWTQKMDPGHICHTFLTMVLLVERGVMACDIGSRMT